MGLKCGQKDAPEAVPEAHAEHPGHFQQLAVSPPDALQKIGIQHRQHHQKGDENTEPPAGQPEQGDDNEGGHRHRFHRRQIGVKQHLRQGEPGRQRRQHQRQQEAQQKAQGDSGKGKAHRLPEVPGLHQGPQPPGHLHRPHQQQRIMYQRRRQLPDTQRQKAGKEPCQP